MLFEREIRVYLVAETDRRTGQGAVLCFVKDFKVDGKNAVQFTKA